MLGSQRKHQGYPSTRCMHIWFEQERRPTGCVSTNVWHLYCGRLVVQEIHAKMLKVVSGSQFGWNRQVVYLVSERERIASPDLKWELMRQKPGDWRFNSRSTPISPSEQVIKALRPSGRTQEPAECRKTRPMFPKSGWHLVSWRTGEDCKLLGRQITLQSLPEYNDLSDLQNPYKNAEMVELTYNSRAGRQTQEDPETHCPISLA